MILMSQQNEFDREYGELYLNVSVAGSLVLYDRISKSKRS